MPKIIALSLGLLAACAQNPLFRSAEKPRQVSAAKLRELDPQWRAAIAQAEPNPAAAERLLKAPPGAQIDVYLGTWCPDSRVEVGRFLQVLEDENDPPFEVDFFTLSNNKSRWPRDGRDLRYVPTFIVKRDGKEIGRVVESAPMGIEKAIADLLHGDRQGVISGRTDL